MHQSHSPTEEPGTGIVTRLETQQCTITTHILESQGQALSAIDTAEHHSHSPAAEPGTSIVTRPKTQDLQPLTS